MVYDPDDTIVAIGTASGGGLRGMLRLSGPDVLSCVASCFRPDDPTVRLTELFFPNVIHGLVTLADEQADFPAKLLAWPTQRSYTRQPSAELHTLGSPPLLDQLLLRLCEGGARLAEPGEFTLRAFLAGRLDLTQAEAVLGVIDAQDSHELQSALAQLAGGIANPLSQLREELLQLLAELEAGLDFVEEDIEFISHEQLQIQLASAMATVATVADQLSSRESTNMLPRVVLSGVPNAGKSSLFNALAERYSAAEGESVALVSEQSGTTRDFVSAILQISSLKFELIDTAGEQPDQEGTNVAQLAQDMTSAQHKQASLVVRCVDARQAHANELADSRSEALVVLTKCDLLSAAASRDEKQLVCSSVDGTGLDQLTALIYARLATSSSAALHASKLTASRCSASLTRAQACISQALQLVEHNSGEELVAAEVRSALDALGQVVGTVYTDDILDRIFGQFCIGK